MKIKGVLMLVCLFCLLACTSRNSMIAIGQVAIPNTASGEVFKEWLASYNSGDTAKIGLFTRLYYHEELIKQKIFDAQEWVGYHKKFGSLALYSFDTTYIDKNGYKWSIDALLTNQNQDKWMRLRLGIGSKSRKIGGISFKTASRPDAIKVKRVSDNALAKQVDEQIEKMVTKDEFSGVMLIARDNKPIYNKAFGMANRVKFIANTIETQFNLASFSKMFTAVAIAQLVQAGKLSYSDTLSRIIPEYPNREVATRVTVHQLLSHTSGMGDVFTPEFFDIVDKSNLKKVEDWYQTFMKYPLQFEPGTQFRYSNAGYIVLGAIIEKLSGLDYDTYIYEKIAKPLGMTKTGFYPVYDELGSKAKPYTYSPSPNITNEKAEEYKDLAKGTSDGGAYSTASDILKFANALRGYKLLNKEQTEFLITSKVSIGEGIPDYAYGCFDNKLNGNRIIGHGGTTPGISVSVEIFWESNIRVIVLGNCDPPAADIIANFVRERITY